MILLKTLTWSNMFSYGSDNSISLSSEPVTQLLGLNGHGKSSIPLIIEEILYNKNSKGIKKSAILNRNVNTNKYNAKLEFSIDNSEYELVISRTGATQKVVLKKDKVDISSHTATDTFKHIEDLLGLDGKTFSQIVYQNNSSSLQFLTATDTNRKKFLIDLLSLEHYTKIFENVKDIHKTVADELIKIQSSVNTIQEWLNKASKESLDLIDLREEFELDSSGKERLTSLNANLENLVSINKKISQNEQYKKLRDSIDYGSLTESVDQVDISHTLQEIGAIKKKIEELKTLEQKFTKLQVSTCPTCMQEINLQDIETMLDSYRVSIKNYIEALKIQENILAIGKEQNSRYEQHQRLVADFEKYSTMIDASLPALLLDKSELEKEVKGIETSITEATKKLTEIKNHNKNAIAHNARVNLLISQLDSEKEKLKLYTTSLISVETKLSLLEVLKKAFSTNGLLAYKIENSVKDLQNLTNYYLTELSDGRFQLNFIINNDKLNVVIIDNGLEVEITALSAGELARVTTSTLLAIRKMMSSLSKSRINLLFLDETIDVLDTFGKEKLIEVLLKEENLNTFLISHGYSHPLIKKIVAVKEEGISRLEDG